MQRKDIDFLLTLLIGILLLAGIVMISSVSVHTSYVKTLEQVAKGTLEEPHNSLFVMKTIPNVIIGFIVMTIFTKIPYQIWEKFSLHLYFLAILLLFSLLFFGRELNGAKWWLDIPWLPSIQPVEFAKLAIIMMIAYFMKKRKAVMSRFGQWFLIFAVYAGLPLLLLALQPDFGSILILVFIMALMFFVGGGNKKILIFSLIWALSLALSVYFVGHTKYGKEVLKIWYISTRLDNFFRSHTDISLNGNGNTDHQLKQWFIAMGSGGMFGLGFWKSIQKYWYLPEVQWDFIFAVIVEEFWFLWWFILILFYVWIMYRGLQIARSVQDLFGKYMAFGITAWFTVQAFVNIGVNLNVIPLTGVTLPFVSYGGSSVVALCIASGILLSISRHAEYQQTTLSDALQARRKVIL